MEERRLAAAPFLRAGRLCQAAIARELGISRAAVTAWKRALERAGVRGLRRRRPRGGPPVPPAGTSSRPVAQLLRSRRPRC